MKFVSKMFVVVAVLCAMLAIWTPVGQWWQWLLSTLLALFVAAYCDTVSDEK